MHAKTFPSPQFLIPAQWNVPRGTIDKLLIYVNELTRWNTRINLVAKSEIQQQQHFWERHILDGLQLVQQIQPDTKIIDLGSGGGIPALILAAAGYSVTAVESDQRKCEFLKEAARQMQVDCRVINKRIETLSEEDIGNEAAVITARACANIHDLLQMNALLFRHAWLLLKGKQLTQELEAARKDFEFIAKTFASHTSDTSDMVQLENITVK